MSTSDRAGQGASVGGDRAGLSPARQEHLRRAEQTARILDSSIRVPGTSRTFGLDALVGLIPGVGDAAGLVASMLVIIQAIRSGARPLTVVHMLVIALADALIGTVPVLGTISDFIVKANERNVALLKSAAEDPAGASQRSARVIALTGVVVIALAVGVGLLGLWLFSRLVALIL